MPHFADDRIPTHDAGLEEPVRRSAMRVGDVHDPAEHEAEAVAAEVVQRLAAQEPGVTDIGGEPAGRVRRAAAGDGHEGHSHEDGFEAPAEVESRIRRATGGGQPLEPDVRRTFEGAMGRDLGAVRVHRGSEANTLNRSIAAKAFTTGNDIFFSEGSYQPGTRAGQHLLAHELTHTAQQGGSVKRTIRRYALAAPDFDATTGVTVFGKGGSIAVAKFDDGSGQPLIVKVAQPNAPEVMLANNLQNAQAERTGGGAGGYSVITPAGRLATPSEVAAIKKVGRARVTKDRDEFLANWVAPEGDKKAKEDARYAKLDKEDRYNGFLANLDSDKPIFVAVPGAGENFSTSFGADVAHTKKDRLGRTKLNENSMAFKILNDPGPMTTLAQIAPVDVMMGMYDRVLGMFNPDNFMFDGSTATFHLIDNTQNQAGGYLTTTLAQAAFGGKTTVVNPKPGFDDWSRADGKAAMLANDTTALAQAMITTVLGPDGAKGGVASILGKHDAKAEELFIKLRTKNAKKMLAWVKGGIEKGKASMLSVLGDPIKMLEGVPDDSREEALQSLLARKYFLQGLDSAAAWQAGGDQAKKMLERLAPKRPKGTSPRKMPKPPVPPKNTKPQLKPRPKGRTPAAIGGQRDNG